MDRVDKNYVNHFRKITFIQPLYKEGEYIKEIYEKLPNCTRRQHRKGERLWSVRHQPNPDYIKGPLEGDILPTSLVVEFCNNCIDAGIEVEFDGQAKRVEERFSRKYLGGI